MPFPFLFSPFLCSARVKEWLCSFAYQRSPLHAPVWKTGERKDEGRLNESTLDEIWMNVKPTKATSLPSFSSFTLTPKAKDPPPPTQKKHPKAGLRGGWEWARQPKTSANHWLSKAIYKRWWQLSRRHERKRRREKGNRREKGESLRLPSWSTS